MGLRIHTATAALLTLAVFAAACASTDTEVESAVETTSTTTTLLEPANTAPSETATTNPPLQPPVTMFFPADSDGQEEFAISQEYNIRKFSGDPTFVDLVHPDLANADWLGVPMYQFEQFFSYDTPYLIEGSCEFIDKQVVCEVVYETDVTRAIGFIAESTSRTTVEDGLITAVESKWNGSGVFGAFFNWLALTYPDEPTCDWTRLMQLEEHTPGLGDIIPGVPAGALCMQTMAALGPEFAQTDDYIAPLQTYSPDG